MRSLPEVLMLALLVPLAASAQGVTEADLIDDTSIAPMLEKLGSMLQSLEEKGVQVTDVHLGRVRDDGVGVPVALAPFGAGSIVVAALGDERRIVDLDLAVTDAHDGRWTDQMSDNNPVVQFDSDDAGEFTATVLIAEPVAEATEGFYVLVSGFVTDPSAVVSAAGMVGELALTASLSEQLSLRVVTGGMTVMTAGQNTAIDLTIPAQSGGRCLIMAYGDPQRTKKLQMAITDKSGNVVGAAKSKRLATSLVVTGSGPSHYRVVLTPKLAGFLDAHAMTVAACQ